MNYRDNIPLSFDENKTVNAVPVKKERICSISASLEEHYAVQFITVLLIKTEEGIADTDGAMPLLPR